MRTGIKSRALALIAGSAAALAALAGTGLGSAAASSSVAGQATFPIPTVPAAVSWGRNSAGELGDGSLTSSPVYVGVTGLGKGVAQVSAAGDHALALTAAGTVLAWGGNSTACLGEGGAASSFFPIPVAGLTKVTQVAAGPDHCLALRSNGTVWAWGENYTGQIGNGVKGTIQLIPVKVHGLTGVVKIAAGTYFSLALKSDGTVWAWGSGVDGELGEGTTTTRLVPHQVKGLTHVVAISAGGTSAFALRANSASAQATVWAWGANENGQLGDGTTSNHLTPELVKGIRVPGVLGISAGSNFAVALGDDDSVWAWGDDNLGQLGDAPTGNTVSRPVETIGNNSGITQLSAGADQVLALLTTGNVLAWGGNRFGQLGAGSTASIVGPVRVTDLTNVTQVSAGGGFSLAIHSVVPSIIGTSR